MGASVMKYTNSELFIRLDRWLNANFYSNKVIEKVEALKNCLKLCMMSKSQMNGFRF